MLLDTHLTPFSQTNLNFNPTKYVYSGSREEKSRLIREDKLPTATEVIRSDLDARDLYRNAVQTKLDDARAEFVYQKKSGFEDASELVRLLREAQGAIDKWFASFPTRTCGRRWRSSRTSKGADATFRVLPARSAYVTS